MLAVSTHNKLRACCQLQCLHLSTLSTLLAVHCRRAQAAQQSTDTQEQQQQLYQPRLAQQRLQQQFTHDDSAAPVLLNLGLHHLSCARYSEV
jgi:hypothetical protein